MICPSVRNNPHSPPATFPLASLPPGKLERTARFIINLTVLFLQSAPALYLKLSDLRGQPFNTIFVLPCQIVDFLYGVVDLLYSRAHLVQAASIVP